MQEQELLPDKAEFHEFTILYTLGEFVTLSCYIREIFDYLRIDKRNFKKLEQVFKGSRNAYTIQIPGSVSFFYSVPVGKNNRNQTLLSK